jgi:phosphoribosylformylglycinamidine synthase subunit PurL
VAIKARRERLYPPIGMEEGLSFGIDDVEWERIVDRLGRNPNHFECSIFATLWSDEVSNKSSAALLQTISRDDKNVVRVPGSKVALVKISEQQYLALRVANNNMQTQLEPFYGVQTAIDYAVEEFASVGASPLAVLNLLRFGSHDLIKNQHLFQGVIDGIGAYGSKYGIPVVGGELYFHEKYNHGLMCNSGLVGVLRTDHALEQAEVSYQNPVLYVGAATGRDGLRKLKKSGDAGAEARERKNRSLIISDPLLANRLVSACTEAVEAGLLREVVTVSSGGLAVACFELARRVNKPVLLDIDRIPIRGKAYEPLEIILSETTERVLMVVDKKNHRALNQVLYKWDLESVKVGEVNDSDGIEFYYNHYLAADIPFLFALGGAVQKQFQVVQFPPMLKRSGKMDDDANQLRKRKRKVQDEWSLVREVSLAKDEDKDREFPCPRHLEDIWLDLLANPNLCSRAAVYRLFDQVVGANTVQRPGGDAAVLRLRGFKTNGEGSAEVEHLVREVAADQEAKHKSAAEMGVALTFDSNSLYVSMEPYLGTVQTIAEGMRNLAAVGARPVALAYCLNFGSPERYREVCDLAESIRGLGDSARIWKIPILSEQISLYNGTEGNPIMPTPAILMAGVLEDIHKTCGVGFRGKGDPVFLVGLTQNEIGCSEYASFTHKFVNRLVPDIEFDRELRTCQLIIELIQKGLLRSAHDLSSGGLSVALTECCMMRPRPIGTMFHIDPQIFQTPNGPVPLRPDAALFSETSGRFLISCKPENEDQVREICGDYEIPITGRGEVGGKSIVIEGAVEAELPISTTYKLWIHRLEILLGQGGEETTGF